jgi:hypothetical protein
MDWQIGIGPTIMALLLQAGSQAAKARGGGQSLTGGSQEEPLEQSSSPYSVRRSGPGGDAPN